MTFDLTGIRPPVISDETLRQLDEYRRFRHMVRNVYAEHLDPKRVGELVEKLSGLWVRLKAELIAFAGFLEAPARQMMLRQSMNESPWASSPGRLFENWRVATSYPSKDSTNSSRRLHEIPMIS